MKKIYQVTLKNGKTVSPNHLTLFQKQLMKLE